MSGAGAGAGGGAKLRLRLATYMCPSHPVQLYELIVELLEHGLDCHAATLGYETRVTGPFADRPDPFQHDQIDLAFVTAEWYMRLRDSKCTSAELLPVSPVFLHELNTDLKPGYFSDIIVHTDKKTHNVNSLMDLRGCAFAYSDVNSLSSSKIVLKTLKEKGENASFFGSQLRSGSHLASAQMVLTKQAEWAAVDATTLLYSKKYMQDGGEDITVLETLGRLPPYPILVNANLPCAIKKEIARVLTTLAHTGEWKKRFAKYGVAKFERNSDGVYERAAAQVRSVQAHTLYVPYY